MEERNKVNEPNWELVAINRRQDARVLQNMTQNGLELWSAWE
jgi:hypothetical protein